MRGRGLFFSYRGMWILIKYALFYLLGWLIHTLIVAGTFASLERYHPAFLARRKSQLEFWISAVASVLAVTIPVGFVWAKFGYIHIEMVLVISVGSLLMDYLRLTQRVLNLGPVKGDTLGYGLGLVLWSGLYFLRR